ncbi:MAG: hypothetical protein ACK4TC_05055 [Sphingomonas pseudosanguinis]|uniref:hypothetical protein n=1 Tax=Sphingomonas pseudosanguinis TaxID=413712 RepID=UPI003918B2C3
MADPKEASKDRLSKIVANLALLGAAGGLIGSFLAAGMDKANVDLFGDKAAIESRTKLDTTIITSIGNIQREVRQIRDAQDMLLRGPAKERDAARIAAITSRLDDISKRQDTLEKAILNNPEKALSLPLLKRDIDSVRDNNNQAVLSMKASVDQVYDLSKWLLGSVALTVISLVATAYFQKK